MSRNVDDFDHFLEEQLRDPAFRKAWEADEAEYQLRRALVEARCEPSEIRSRS